jgi:hypothetical protein
MIAGCMRWRKRILQELLTWDERFGGADPSKYLASLHLSCFRNGEENVAAQAAINQMIQEGLILSCQDDKLLVVGVRLNPARMKDVLAEISQAKWYQDLKMLISVLTGLLGILGAIAALVQKLRH